METKIALNTIGHIMMAVREEMIRLEEQHSCILTSAILTEVLHRNGYQLAYTLRVRVRIVNRAFKDHIERFGSPNTPDAIARFDAAGAAMIGLGEGSAEAMPEGRWPGHTVVIVPGVISSAHLMSDATTTQVNRPELQIELQPFVAIVQDEFVKGERPFRHELNGCLVSYTALPGDREHEATDLWTSKSGVARVADLVMNRL